MPTDTLSVRVAAADALTPQIRSFRLVACDGARLPGFAPGAHVQVAVKDATGSVPAWRSYSLIRLDAHADPAQPVAEYRIAVRLEDEGRGGSRYMHEHVTVGDVLSLRPPSNHFPLLPQPEIILLAGGIGITPLVSMATALLAQKRPFVMHYSGRTLAQLVFVDELLALVGDRLHLHADDNPTTRLSIDALLSAATPTQPIYVCGPGGLIDATLRVAQARGWALGDVHFERFTEATPLAGDQPFDVELGSSGRVIHVAADMSVLDALAAAGVDVMHDCRAGRCGLCSTGVRSGAIDHRDSYLSQAEKDSGRLMQVCVSRAKTGPLVLDL